MSIAWVCSVLDLFDAFIGPPAQLLRTALLGVLAYASLVLVLRVSGKRTLSKLNAFDLVVTVALGSCLATILLSNASLLQGLIAFLVLIGMQFVVAWLSARSSLVSSLVKAAPALVYYQGEVLHEALRRERLTVAELEAAARGSGLSALCEARGIVLETDGKLSVLRDGPHEGSEPRSASQPRLSL